MQCDLFCRFLSITSTMIYETFVSRNKHIMYTVTRLEEDTTHLAASAVREMSEYPVSTAFNLL